MEHVAHCRITFYTFVIICDCYVMIGTNRLWWFLSLLGCCFGISECCHLRWFLVALRLDTLRMRESHRPISCAKAFSWNTICSQLFSNRRMVQEFMVTLLQCQHVLVFVCNNRYNSHSLYTFFCFLTTFDFEIHNVSKMMVSFLLMTKHPKSLLSVGRLEQSVVRIAKRPGSEVVCQQTWIFFWFDQWLALKLPPLDCLTFWSDQLS